MVDWLAASQPLGIVDMGEDGEGVMSVQIFLGIVEMGEGVMCVQIFLGIVDMGEGVMCVQNFRMFI